MFQQLWGCYYFGRIPPFCILTQSCYFSLCLNFHGLILCSSWYFWPQIAVPFNFLRGCVFVGHGDKVTYSAALVAISRNHDLGCLHLRQWPVTYLMTLSNWTMSCQPGPPRAPHGQWLRWQLDSTRRKASEICLRPPLDIYFHTFSR